MSKKSDAPICLRCGEDSKDLVEKNEHKRFTGYYCSVCGLSWVVAKPLPDVVQ